MGRRFFGALELEVDDNGAIAAKFVEATGTMAKKWIQNTQVGYDEETGALLISLGAGVVNSAQQFIQPVTFGSAGGVQGVTNWYDASSNIAYKMAGNGYFYCGNGCGIGWGSIATASFGVDVYLIRTGTRRVDLRDDSFTDGAALGLKLLHIMTETTAPASPAAGVTLFVDSADHEVRAKKANGAVVGLEAKVGQPGTVFSFGDQALDAAGSLALNTLTFPDPVVPAGSVTYFFVPKSTISGNLRIDSGNIVSSVGGGDAFATVEVFAVYY